MIKRQFLVMNEKDVLGGLYRIGCQKKMENTPLRGGECRKRKKPDTCFSQVQFSTVKR